MDVREQIEKKIIVCPKTHDALRIDDENNLVTTDKGVGYRLINSLVPVFHGLNNTSLIDNTDELAVMTQKYNQKHVVFDAVKSLFRKDYRSALSKRAFSTLCDNMNASSVFLSVGGGPQKQHPCMTNLNIDCFPNVDIVADGHLLPYGNEIVDAIYCEAVIEHLKFPHRAIKEFHRVLKEEALVFVATPFLQAYHGYPHHYQNYTCSGQVHLLESNGFEVLQSGVCTGPMLTISHIISIFLRDMLPKMIGMPLRMLWEIFSLFIKPFDMYLNAKDESHILACSTFVLAKKCCSSGSSVEKMLVA